MLVKLLVLLLFSLIVPNQCANADGILNSFSVSSKSKLQSRRCHLIPEPAGIRAGDCFNCASQTSRLVVVTFRLTTVSIALFCAILAAKGIAPVLSLSPDPGSCGYSPACFNCAVRCPFRCQSQTSSLVVVPFCQATVLIALFCAVLAVGSDPKNNFWEVASQDVIKPLR